MREVDQHVGATIAAKYRIRRVIGVGGMGAVYEGQHIDLGKKVAIKIIDSAADTSAELAARFKREARAASAVESDGIVQVFDVGSDPKVGLFMVMELLQGEDLEMRLRKQPGRRLDPAIVAQIGYQVARALVKAHTARVVHRDLKPANIFLTDRDDGSLRVKILDFGISKLLAGEASSIATKEGGGAPRADRGGDGARNAAVHVARASAGTRDGRSSLRRMGARCGALRSARGGRGVPGHGELPGHDPEPTPDAGSPLARAAPWVPETLAKVVHAAIQHDLRTRIGDCAAFAALLEEAIPEAATASTGRFNSVQRARLASVPSLGRYLAPWVAGMPASSSPARGSSVARPITLGDDTQVVVRPSDPRGQRTTRATRR